MKYPIFKVHVDAGAVAENMGQVLASGYVAEGVQVLELAQALEDHLGASNLVLVNSCTSALTLALKLSGVGPGTEVITTSMTCLATNTPILNLGAKPVWCDIDPRTAMLDPGKIHDLVTPRTRAILFVDWSGIPANLESLSGAAEEHGLPLIQDAAHAFGAKYQDKNISEWADFTCYSFQAIKHFTTGDGGALVCRSEQDYKRAKNLRWFGIDREASKDKEGNWKGQAWNIDVPEAGYKFHMNNITASIGLSQMPHASRIVGQHMANGEQYREHFAGHRLITPLEFPEGCDPTYWVYTVLLAESVDRDAVLAEMYGSGIEASVVHVPNHPYTCFRESRVDLPQTEYFANHQISLPCGWWLDSQDIDHIAGALKDLCDLHRR